MLKLSTTLIYDSFCLLKWLSQYPVSKRDRIEYLSNYISMDPKVVFSCLRDIGMVTEKNDYYSLSEDTLHYFENGENSSNTTLNSRFFIKSFIEKANPSWAGRIPFGRQEVYIFLSEEEQRCFMQANLLNDYSKETIDWWDEVANVVRANNGLSLLEIGRTGEYLTLEYESNRVNKPPKLVSIDSNLLGYDVESIVSEKDNSPLFIEVKTSSQDHNEPCIFVSANEWDVAVSSDYYLFYIWVISGERNELMIVNPGEMSDHIPNNNGSGSWTNVRIPLARLGGQQIKWGTKNA